MSEPRRRGVILCRGGALEPEALAFRRLKWIAEAAAHPDQVFEVTQACQADGAVAVARLVKEKGLDEFILGACPLAGPGGPISQELSRAGLASQATILDLFTLSEASGQECQVNPGAQQSLSQALAAAAFDQPVLMEPFAVSKRVLVVGDGLAALLSARHLAEAGYAVVLLTPTKRLAPPQPLLGPEAAAEAARLAKALEDKDEVTILRQGRLLELSGAAGQFTAHLMDREGQVSEHYLGAVIVAQGPPKAINFGPLQVEPSERVVPLSELAALTGSPEYMKRLFEGRKSPAAAVAVGLGVEAGPLALRAAARAARELTQAHGAEVLLLTGNAKVAAPDLEALTQQARREGVILVKFSRPEIAAEADAEGVTLRFKDEVLGREVSQRVDILGLDEAPAPDKEYLALASRLGLVVGRDGYLQPDFINALPVYTPRAGVLAVGPARGASDLEGQVDEVQDAVLSVRRLLKQGQVQVEAAKVQVDRHKCAICLTCVRVCPEKAMGRLDRRPVVNPLACVGCGACAAECPMDAIQLIKESDARYQAEIEAAVERGRYSLETEASQELLVFMCANSAARALNAARLKGRPWPAGVSVIQVPCAAKIDPAMVLSAFREGFDGVMMLSCFEDACYNLQGAAWAKLRVEHLKRLLSEAGHDPRRLVRAAVAPSMSSEVMRLLERTKAEMAGLGPNPLKVGAQVRDILSRFTTRLDETFAVL